MRKKLIESLKFLHQSLCQFQGLIGPMVPKGRKLRWVPMIPKGRNLRWVPMGTQGYYPKKSTGMGWVGFASRFHGYFRVGYPKRLVILGSFGYQTRG